MRDDAAARPTRLAEYAPPAFSADEIDLSFALAPRRTRVRARTRFRRLGAADAPLVLDGVRLSLERIAIDGRDLTPSEYALEPERLILPNVPDAFTLETEVLIDPADNTALEGLYMSGGRYCTQCEAEGFRKITYALDRPDALSRYTVRVEAEKAEFPTLLSNGDLVEAGDLDGGRHYALWRDPFPKPAYLFALVAGRFDTVSDVFTTRSGRTVEVAVRVDPGDGNRAHYALDALKRAMRWDEEAFGREYDLGIYNIVAVRDFNFGAMENKGLNVFNSAYVLADPASATDADYEAIESIVAHEYFHNWTGNRITLRDWFQLCLKEGLTVFRDQEFSAEQRSRPVQRIKDVKRLRARQFPEDAGPLAHPVRPSSYFKIDNFYTATVYEKGAEIIRALKSLIGAEAFARGMDLYFARCDGTAATVEDFLGAFEEASGQSLDHFKLWYEQAGTPTVEARGAYDPRSQRYTLRLKQSTPPTPGQPDKAALPIPLRIGFVSKDGAVLAARLAGEEHAREEHALAFDAAEMELVFEGVVARPTPALLRGFSAPVKLDLDLSEDDLLVQMAHDPDAFTRWEAGQTLARRLLIARAAGANAPAERFFAALSKELDRASADPAFAALALRLPDLAELIQTTDAPDPERLHAAREALRAEAARSLEAKLVAIVASPPDEAFSPDAAAAGRRALRTAAIDLLGALGETHAERIEAVFMSAGSLTESLAALDALGLGAAERFDRALDAFYARWREDPLVLDKWFSLQAAQPRDDALDRVRALSRHADFDLKNPNRVRALALGLATRNPRAFHAADGAGYAFLAELASAIDERNPALAARLLGPFESWRRFDEGRQARARAALERLAAKSSLSRNAREIVERTLA